ncbi:MAG: radical SAM protein [Thermodesulfobacteriota bacterium]
MTFNLLKLKQHLRIIGHNPWLLGLHPNILNYLKYKIEKKRTTVDIHKRGVVYTTLYLTRRCNLNCRFCIVARTTNTRDHREFEMSPGQCRRIMEHPAFNRSLYVMLSGGEPLLNDHIGDIVRLLKGQKRIVSVTTNGLLLPRKLDRLLEAGLDSINISVYDETIEKLREIVPVAAAASFVKLCKLVTRDMLHDPGKVEEAAELAAASNCGGLYLANVLPGPGTSHDISAGVVFENDPAFEPFQRRLKRKFPGLPIHFFAPLQRTPRKRVCQIPWYLGIVDNQGNYGFCCYDHLCNKGNIYDEALSRFHNGDPWPRVRGEILDPSAPMTVFCRNCYLLNDRWAAKV